MDLKQITNLKSEAVDGVAVLSFHSGCIHDEKQISLTLESLSRYVDGRTGLRIVFDMSNVDYMASAGLGLLVGLLKTVKRNEGEFKLCCLEDSIDELFCLMQFDKIFAIFKTRDEALASFTGVSA